MQKLRFLRHKLIVLSLLYLCYVYLQLLINSQQNIL